MQLNEYQLRTKETAVYPKIDNKKYMYPVLGLAGEVGELLNKVKKIFRDGKGRLTPTRKKDIEGELGDILWYLARTASEFNVSLEDLARDNLKKLDARKTKSALEGDGDNR